MLNSMLMCLALNVYFEARSDTMTGQYAVAQVVINRVQSSKFPDDVCSVVKQSRNDGTCQFSWYCDGKKDIIWATYMNGDVIQENMTAWRDSIHVALFMMSGNMKDDITKGAVFYYNPHIANPAWGAIYDETITIGNHRFMKDK